MLFHRHWSAIALSEAATHVTILSRNTHLTFCCPDTAFNLMHFSASVIVWFFSVEKTVAWATNTFLMVTISFGKKFHSRLWEEPTPPICSELVSCWFLLIALTLYWHCMFTLCLKLQIACSLKGHGMLGSFLHSSPHLWWSVSLSWVNSIFTILVQNGPVLPVSFSWWVLSSKSYAGPPVKRLELYESSGMNLNHHNIMETHLYLFKPDHINYICNL